MQWTVQLGAAFSATTFEAAFAGFRRLYHVKPERVICAPDVLTRYAQLFARSGAAAHGAHALRYDGIPLRSAVVAPGTVTFEGEVDEERMGDW